MEQVLEWVRLLTGYTPLALLVSTAVHLHQDQDAKMAEKAYVVHHTPGRVRLRIPAKRHDEDFFSDIEHRLRQCPSVHAVRANPHTSSVLIGYTGELESLMIDAAGAGLAEVADIEMGLPPIEPIGGRLRSRLTEISGSISRATNGTIDGEAAVILSLLLAGGLQVIKGQTLGPAVPLLWYAAQAMGMMPSRASDD